LRRPKISNGLREIFAANAGSSEISFCQALGPVPDPCRFIKEVPMPTPRPKPSATGAFSRVEYERLAEFRYHLARFLRRRKDAARAEGLQAQQYELLLSVAGLPPDAQPTVKEIARQLCLEHHTVVELADRLEKRGLLKRQTSADDRRVVLLHVTREGQATLNRIVRFSFAQLREEAPELIRSLRRLLTKPPHS
jgi:DNA-binding MarR family transcriptional regulator